MGLQKHINLASFALGNIMKYRTRSIAVVVALIISSSLICSMEFIREGLVTDIENSLDEGPDIIVQRLEAGRQAEVPIDWQKNITNIPGVRLCTPRVWGYASVGREKFITIMGVNATEYGEATESIGTSVDRGRFLNGSDRRRIVIGEGIIDLMHAASSPVTVDVGSTISLIAYNGTLIEFEIIGVFSSKAKIFNYDMIVTDIDSARLLFGLAEDVCTDYAIWIDFGESMNDVAYRLDHRFSEARVLTRDAISDLTLRSYNDRTGLLTVLWTTVLLSVLILAFATSSAISEEARREVGLLKALGFDTVDILEIRSFESLTVSILGASLGVTVSIVFDFVLGAPGLAAYLLGWSFVLINGNIPLAITPITVFLVYVLAVVPIFIATVVPSWRSAIIEPDVVMRGI